MSAAVKRRVFRQLHESGCFVIPNPWDLGSARMLEGLGFKALATTSSGFAWSRARPDNGITLDMALAHLAEMVEGTSVPINADFEGGFAADADVYELGPSIDFRKTRLAFSGTEFVRPASGNGRGAAGLRSCSRPGPARRRSGRAVRRRA